jgi:hypothetical protein
VDATHAPPDQLPLAQAVLAYRSPYLVASDRGRLNGSPRSLTPLYLERDAQAISVIRLLTVGWRVLTLLAGLSAGHPKRATARPTTERRLTRVAGVPLTLIRKGAAGGIIGRPSHASNGVFSRS